MVSFCSPANKGFAQSSLLEAECRVCKWEILLFPFLIYYQWSLVWTKQKKPQRIKSTENVTLGHRSILQFLTVKFTARTQSVFAASPHHFLSSCPDTSGHAGTRRGQTHTVQGSVEVVRRHQEQAGWLAPTWSWEHFPRGLDKEGAEDQRRQEEKEVLRTGDRAGSCPQKTEAVMPVSGACWRISYLLFQELTVISTAVLTKADQLLPAQPWLLALQLTQLMSTESTYAAKTLWHRADNAIKRVLQVLEWVTIVPSPCL